MILSQDPLPKLRRLAVEDEKKIVEQNSEIQGLEMPRSRLWNWHADLFFHKWCNGHLPFLFQLLLQILTIKGKGIGSWMQDKCKHKHQYSQVYIEPWIVIHSIYLYCSSRNWVDYRAEKSTLPRVVEGFNLWLAT